MGTASRTDPLDVVRAFNAVMTTKDFARALRVVADECEYMNGPLGTVTGPEGISDPGAVLRAHPRKRVHHQAGSRRW